MDAQDSLQKQELVKAIHEHFEEVATWIDRVQRNKSPRVLQPDTETWRATHASRAMEKARHASFSTYGCVL